MVSLGFLCAALLSKYKVYSRHQFENIFLLSVSRVSRGLLGKVIAT